MTGKNAYELLDLQKAHSVKQSLDVNWLARFRKFTEKAE